ncbi:MAG: hypothetical protein ACHQIL_10505, partial [Steroidobacterales bacterium]
PLVIPIRIYAAVIPVLIIAETASLVARSRFNAALIPGYRQVRAFVFGLLDGSLNWGVALLALYGGTLAGTVWVLRWWTAQYQTPTHSFVALAVHLAVFAVVTFALIVAAIATWRSLAGAARRYMPIGTLATLGRLFVVGSVGVALVAYALVMPRIGYSLSEALQLLPGPAWSISPAGTPGALRLSGEFQRGVSDGLAHVLTHDPSIDRLELDSPGGSVEEGLELAALVDKYTLSTFVGHKCSSACTLVFISGRERVLADGARLGFHRAQGYAWDEIRYEDDGATDRLITFVRSKGVAEDFARKAYAVPNSDIWYPSADELLAAGVIGRKPLQEPAPF